MPLDEHVMRVDYEVFYKQYGASTHYKLVCSCGYEDPHYSPGSPESKIKGHRDQVILAKLGLRFSEEPGERSVLRD